VDDVDAFKRLKVPEDIRGCHTAVVHGYYLGAHVPLQAAERLLKQRPALAGLAVAGMPKGSLGMGTAAAASYDIVAVPRDGSNTYVSMSVSQAEVSL
jgi:hypothetical protein